MVMAVKHPRRQFIKWSQEICVPKTVTTPDMTDEELRAEFEAQREEDLREWEKERMKNAHEAINERRI
jgi:hypothetical protein